MTSPNPLTKDKPLLAFFVIALAGLLLSQVGVLGRTSRAATWLIASGALSVLGITGMLWRVAIVGRQTQTLNQAQLLIFMATLVLVLLIAVMGLVNAIHLYNLRALRGF